MKGENTSKYNHYLFDLIVYLKMNPKSFSHSLGFDRADRIYNVLKGKNAVSSDLAQIINNVYPETDYNWLITGSGRMLIHEGVKETKKEAPFEELPIDAKLNILYKLVLNQNEIIEKQDKKIDNLINENAELNEQNVDIKERLKDNLFILQSEIELIMVELNVQVDDKLKKDIEKIINQN